MWVVSVNPPAGTTQSQSQHITTRQQTGISAHGLATALSQEYAQTPPYGPSQEVPLERILASLWGFYLEGSVRRLNIIGANAYDECHMDYEDNNKPKPKVLNDKWKFSIKNSLKPPYRIEINQYVYKSTETPVGTSNKKEYIVVE